MLRILFVHPDPKLTSLYQKHFSQFSLFDSAYNGLLAKRLINYYKPHAIISDYSLPWLSGIGLLKYVRRHKDLHTTPFIFLSNHPITSEALNFGANDWLKINEVTPSEVLAKTFAHIQLNRKFIHV